jgi:LL-H family phage holin
MTDLVFYIINLLLVIIISLIARHVIPYLKEQLGAEKLEAIEKWTNYAVLAAEQTLQTQSGSNKKAYVTQFLKELLTAKNLALSDEQINILIESAVKAMNAGTGTNTNSTEE